MVRLFKHLFGAFIFRENTKIYIDIIKVELYNRLIRKRKERNIQPDKLSYARTT